VDWLGISSKGRSLYRVIERILGLPLSVLPIAISGSSIVRAREVERVLLELSVGVELYAELVER
jgi:hypothetical protein